MYILLLCIVFICLIILIYNSSQFDFREAVIKAVLLLSTIIVFITEGLSYFNQINTISIIVTWLVILLLIVAIALKSVKDTGKLRSQFREKLLKTKLILQNYKLFSFNTLSFILLLLLVGTLFFEAFSITNNYDSYTYHLPKIENWIKNENVSFYPTNNFRQLYIVPLSEYIILNLKLLSNSNLFNNFVQFFSYLFSGVIVSLLIRLFNGGRKQQYYGLIFALTVPMAVLQSVTTQTDLLVSLFILSFVYFSFKIIKNSNFTISDFVFASISVALGIFAKTTFYIFALPFGLVLSFYLLQNLKWKVVKLISITMGILLAINLPFLFRNYQLFGSILGPVSGTSYYLENTNSIISLKIMISNLIKNTALHLPLPNEYYNNLIFRTVSKLHKILGLTLNDSKSNFLSIPFDISYQVQHDAINNFLHTLLIFCSPIIYTFSKKIKSKLLSIYIICTVTTYFLFALVLKWQPWQTRLDLPFFLIFIPFIVLILNKKVVVYISLILLFSILSIVYCFDSSKAVFTSKSFVESTDSDYIINYDYAMKTKSKLEEYNINKIGFIFENNFAEWGYWIVLNQYDKQYIAYNPVFNKLILNNDKHEYQAIIIDDEMFIKLNVSDFVAQDANVQEVVKYDNKTTLVILKQEQNNIFYTE